MNHFGVLFLLVLVALIVAIASASAKTFPRNWNGECIYVSHEKYDRYHHTNPDSVSPYQKGYIPPDMEESRDPEECIPETIKAGPK